MNLKKEIAMGFRCGIVGLPNVGKSTLFNALLQSIAAEAANYPFCTIEPNIGMVSVPDDRLTLISAIGGSAKIIPTQIEFVDIAGLVKGASKGEGLGNQFLSHIRGVDAIVQVLRCFEDENVTHVHGKINPLDDAEVIELELIFADLDSLEKRLPQLEKKAKTNKELVAEYELSKQVIEVLKDGKPARVLADKVDLIQLKNLQLLTTKPVLYICNVSEEDINGNAYTKLVAERAQKENAECVLISAKIEAEISMLEDLEERQMFLENLGLNETGLARLIRAGYHLLGLITYFTVGPKEARAWTITKGTTAPQAAGVIHTDFEKGFIRAETISYNDYVSYKGEAGARDAGKLRLEGKEYIVCDGDIMHFRFNV
jgi:GTP-binding protein YchF